MNSKQFVRSQGWLSVFRMDSSILVLPISFMLRTTFRSSSFVFLPLVWKRINLFFDTLTAILFDLSQFAIFCSSLFTWATHSGRFALHAKTAVSSANKKEDNNVEFGKSLIKHKNKIGPSILPVPCSTEISIFLVSDKKPFISTCCFLLLLVAVTEL